ncbi:cGMP-dependent 3',5'-cyclic phosphodiesterase-like isoform X2 [Clavelina lepadiformis]|uniref:cGMP-dependent 3',5'-cyclic phosphodiesterase-like isoform X2 n=1 Tax=Clavelina lepadiformis TaxID=159417 RepID=UPI004041A496
MPHFPCIQVPHCLCRTWALYGFMRTLMGLCLAIVKDSSRECVGLAKSNMILLFPQLFLSVYQLFTGNVFKGANNADISKTLSDALLLLWRVNSLLEFVEFLRVVLRGTFSGNNYVHCFFITQGDYKLEDFYTNRKISSSLARKYQNISSCDCITLTADDGLIQNSYVSLQEKVSVVHVTDNTDNLSKDLLFLVCAKSPIGDSCEFDLFIRHASECFTRLKKQHPSDIEAEKAFAQLPIELDSATDASTMQMILNNYLSQETSSEQCCILLVLHDIGQIVCQIVDDEVLNFEFCHPTDEGLFSHLCRDAQPYCNHDLTQSDKEQLESLFGSEVHSSLCVPITDKHSRQTIGIVCLCNKKKNNRFNLNDVAVVNAVMAKTWTVLASSLTLQKERKARQECEAMLQIARNLFTHLDDVGMLLGEIIQEARTLTNAERCSVFLVDKASNELVSKVFDGIVTIDESLDPRQYDFENITEVRIPLSQGVAGHVAITGKTLNISDAYSHPLFYRGIDDTTGFRTRNILCFPIKDHNGVVVGVSQLCNKIKGPCFTSYDTALAEKFAVFSGISISHSLLYKQVEEAGSRNQLANELVTYHMKVDKDDIVGNIPDKQLTLQQFDENFDKFCYPPRSLCPDHKIKACIWMYEDLGLISKFHISMHTLVHFILMVRKGYREPPYHNWDHAFSVMHHAYLLAKNLELNDKLSDLEIIALLTACICHDVDHRGTNNAFQVNSKSALASLYSSEGSVLERHHFAQTVCILSTSGCNIFENMKRKDYAQTLDLIKNIILATDVATHLQIMPQLEDLAKNGLNLSSKNHRMLLLSLCMTASDLSDQTKNWKTTKNTSKLIYKEFFSQGDLEKRMGNLPAIINDRERACVPQLQINFIEHIALPAYKVLANLFAEYIEVYERVQRNLKRWRLVEKEFLSRGLPNNDSLDFLTDEFDRHLFEELGET